MVVWLLVVLLFVFGVLPLGMGNALLRSKNLPLVFVSGLFAEFTLFWGLGLIFHATLGSLRLMTMVWLVLCAALAVWGGRRWRRGEHPVRRAGPVWTPAQRLLLAAVLALVCLHVLNTVLNTYYGCWDDETYVGVAAASWYTDTVGRCPPYSLTPKPAFYDPQYNIPCFPLLSAVLAVLTGVHPAILFRTVLPALEIPFAYAIAWLLLQRFWQGARGRCLLSMFYYQVILFVTSEHMDHIGAEWWFCVETWTGKSLICAIPTPLILWLLILLDDAGADKADRREVWKALLLVCWGSCFVSATLFFLIPVELAVWGGLYLLRTRRWKEAVNFAVCGLPAVLCIFFCH